VPEAISSSASVLVDRPIAEVWAFVSDVEKMDLWAKGVTEPRLASEGEVAPGSIFTSKFTHRKRTFDVRYTVTVCEPPSRFGIESEGLLQYSGVMELESVDGATRVTNTVETGGERAAGGLLAGLLRWGMRRQLAKELGTLKRVIERGE
jgi:carbon monoxide dehydrogenase subunit G